MVTTTSRRGFLRGDLRGERAPLRPPWSGGEAAFSERCDRCRACLTACPTHILVAGAGGFPAVDFSRGECTFCGRCAEVCEAGALDRERAPQWRVAAVIGDGCMARHGVECRSCGDHCDRRAIRFRLRAGGAALPHLEAAACNGCGACVRPCPTAAIRVRELTPAEAC